MHFVLFWTIYAFNKDSENLLGLTVRWKVMQEGVQPLTCPMGSWVPSPSDVSRMGERLWVYAVHGIGSCSWRGTTGQHVLES